jgi:hypothetical protein
MIVNQKEKIQSHLMDSKGEPILLNRPGYYKYIKYIALAYPIRLFSSFVTKNIFGVKEPTIIGVEFKLKN